MMSDHLKQFIETNRSAFDNEEPGTEVYKKILQRINAGNDNKAFRFPFRYAAAIAGIIIVGLGFYFLSIKNNQSGKSQGTDTSLNENKNKGDDMSFIGDPSYAKQISQFQFVIGLKQEELKQLKKDYPELYNQFVTDINELDSSYQSLKIKLAETPNREMLLEAMIQNLQLQSELLNRQLIIIKEIKQKTKSHAKTNA